jgi:hypothetical protein
MEMAADSVRLSTDFFVIPGTAKSDPGTRLRYGPNYAVIPATIVVANSNGDIDRSPHHTPFEIMVDNRPGWTTHIQSLLAFNRVEDFRGFAICTTKTRFDALWQDGKGFSRMDSIFSTTIPDQETTSSKRKHFN